MKLTINTDGASRGNPGPASYSFIIKNSSGVILHQESEKIGITTNNVAEYTAVLKSFEYIQRYLTKGIPYEIEVISDSQLVMMQLSGKYKLKDPKLRVLFDQIKVIELGLGVVSYRNVPRKENYIADMLANQALDK